MPSSHLALTDAAVALATQNGWPVFPCKADKAPATARGFKDATTHPAHIRTMCAHAAMIGVPTGRDTFVAIDVDAKGEPSGMAWLEANRHRLPRTREHRTGSGGVHLLFRHPPGGPDIRNSAGALVPHVDVRGVGGYVIAPPSPGYSVTDDAPIASMPDWLAEDCLASKKRVRRPSRWTVGTGNGVPTDDAPAPVAFDPAQVSTPYGLAALQAECDAIRSAPFGQQERTLNAAALKIGALVAGGELNHGEARAALIDAGESMPCEPEQAPWTPREIAAKVTRAMTDGARNPRRAPNPTLDTPFERGFAEREKGRAARDNGAPASRLQAGIRETLARAMERDRDTHQAVIGWHRVRSGADRGRDIAEPGGRA